MPGAALSHVVHVRGEMRERRPHQVERSRRAPDHDRERPRLRRLGSAGDACVEVLDTALGEPLVDPPRRGRRGRAQVDDDLALPAVGRNAVRAEDDRLDDGAVGQREQDDVHALATRASTDCAGVAVDRATASASRSNPRTLLAGLGQAPSDPAAHVPEPYDAELHAEAAALSSSRIGIPSAHAWAPSVLTSSKTSMISSRVAP